MAIKPAAPENKQIGRKKLEFAPGILLTPMQHAYVMRLVRDGCTPNVAAKHAGFVSPKTAGYDLMRLPHVLAAIRFERERYISGDLANVATRTLRAVMDDSGTPAAARVQAARTVLEMAGHLGRNSKAAGSDEEKPLTEMSPDELARAIEVWTTERAALAKPLNAADVELVDTAQGMAGLQPDAQP